MSLGGRPSVRDNAKWNGKPTRADRGTAVVAEVHFPDHWTDELVGERIAVVRVNLDREVYGAHVAYLDDREGEGWAKVTDSPDIDFKDLSIEPGSFEADE